MAGTNLELIREENLKKIEAHMQAIRKLAGGCGLTGEELVEMFRILEVEE